MLAGGRSLWRTRDVKAPLPVWEEIRTAGNDLTSAIAVAPGHSDTIWVGLNNGEIWQTRDGTADVPTWSAIDDNSLVDPLPDRYVTRILVDPLDPLVVYVAFGGFDVDNLYVTDDGGLTWTDLTGEGETGLPDGPVRGVARHPANPNWLFVGTEVGVFASQDGGLTWSTNDYGPAAVSVDELVFLHHSETLLAATHGRGLFTADLATQTLTLEVPTLVPGREAEMVVTGAEPGETVYFGLSTAGDGQLFLDNLGVTIALDAPRALGAALADPEGRATLTKTLPEDADGAVWLQAAAHGATSQLVTTEIVDE